MSGEEPRGYLVPLAESATTTEPPEVEPERDPTSPNDDDPPPEYNEVPEVPAASTSAAPAVAMSSRLPAPGPDVMYVSAASLLAGTAALALSTEEPDRIRQARVRQEREGVEAGEKEVGKGEEVADEAVAAEFAEGERRLLARRGRAGGWAVTNWSIKLGVSFYVILRAIFGYVGFKPFGKLNLADKHSTIATAAATSDSASTLPTSLSPPPIPPPTPSPPPTATSAPTSTIRQLPRLTPKTLVLDLDETLIHSTSRPYSSSRRTRQLKVRVVEVVLDGRSTVYTVYKRPWVDFFLRKVSAWYTVVIFTASLPEYADPVIDWLDGGDGGGGMVGGRLFRADCVHANGSYLKDLSVVEPDLARVCLVDNSPASYAINQANGIPIEGWINDPNDECLLDLLPVLDSLRFTNDVRRVLGLRGFGRA